MTFFTICELLRLAYYDAVTASNIINGFARSGLWCAATRGPDMTRIRPVEYTASGDADSYPSNRTTTRSRTALVQSSDQPRVRVETANQLYALFLRNAEQLCSDGTVEENGTVKVTTRSGATLTSDNVVAAVRAADERRKEEIARKEAAASAREARRAAREQEEASKKRRRDEREEENLQKLKQARIANRERAASSRGRRRLRARQLAHARASHEAATALLRCSFSVN
eukprot:IDg60t1